MKSDFYLTDDQRMIRDLARKVAREKIAPHAADVDERERYPEEAMQAIVEAGLFGIWVPEAYGGSDLGVLALSLVSEEIAWACAASATQYLDQALGGLPILRRGHRRAEEALPAQDRLGGATERLLAVGTGSRLRRRRAQDHGRAAWRPLRAQRHQAVVHQRRPRRRHLLFATVDPARRARGVTAFLVDTSTPGFTVGKKERKMGIRGSPTVALHFTDCQVPVEQRLGEEGEGFAIAMRTLDVTRPATGAMAVGIAQAALDAATAYAKERRQFGQRIADFQGIQFMLADMAMQVPRGAAHGPPRRPPGGRRRRRQYLEASMAKCWAGDAAMRVATDAVQVFGGYGYTREFPVERFMRDAKIMQIYEGTNQIQRTLRGARPIPPGPPPRRAAPPPARPRSALDPNAEPHAEHARSTRRRVNGVVRRCWGT